MQVSELSLSGNQLKQDALQRLRFKPGKKLGGGSAGEQGAPLGGSAPGLGSARGDAGVGVETGEDAAALAALRAGAEVIDCRAGCRNEPKLVTLNPMEVRTFEFVWA